MDCDDVRELILLYFYGELDEEHRRLVDEHISSCDTCSRELKSLRRFFEITAPPPVPEMGERFWTDNASQIIERLSRRSVRKAVARPNIRSFVMPAIDVAAAAVILLAVLVRTGPDTAPAGRAYISESTLAEVAFSVEVDQMYDRIEEFWLVGNGLNGGFDSRFDERIGNIEGSIEMMMMEMKLVEHDRKDGSA